MNIKQLKEYIKDIPDDNIVEIKKSAGNKSICIISLWWIWIVTKLI